MWRLALAGGEAVLRRYRRGGLPARLGLRRYLWLGLERSRPWREWRLLARLWREGLPVPRPLAACVWRRGWVYEGALLTAAVPGARTLAERLRDGPLPAVQWRKIGAVLSRFHARGVDHADLNAHNILFDAGGAVHLIDFDRGRLRRPGGRWARGNLARLARSLAKLAAAGAAWSPADWAALLDGYRGGRR